LKTCKQLIVWVECRCCKHLSFTSQRILIRTSEQCDVCGERLDC